MSEYIGKQEAINYCREKQKEIDCEHAKAIYDCFIEIIKKQPAADVQEVRHGKWEKIYDKYPQYVCTSCNHIFNNKSFKYCPYCGARMDGDEK